jgi:hypothetical protein
MFMATLRLRQRLFLLAGLLPIFVALIVYAVTWSFVWDEGFHMVAAQLIAEGKTPYIDFCFPQTPLNAYANAAILLAFGDHWRPVHVFAAIYIGIAVWLAADFVLSRMPVWRLPCALTTGTLFGLNIVVMQFGPAGQAYALCLLAIVAAFRAAVRAIQPAAAWFAMLTGLLAGVANGSSLLTAPVTPVLLLWLWFCNKSGSRIAKAAAFAAGFVVPFIPVIRLYLRAPAQTLFNVVRYQALFRRVNWGDANLRDFDALTSWLTSPDALLLAALSAGAVIFLFRQAKQEAPLLEKTVRAEFWLAGALSLALSLFLATAHPTFERYFILVVPFLSMLSAVGLWAIGTRLATPQHSILPAALVITLTALLWGRALFDEREDEHWSDYEEVAAKVAEVTPIGARLYADELIYFILQRTPPAGMEFSYAEKLDLPDAQEKLFHIISLTKLKKQVKAGQFATLQTCRDSILDSFEPEKTFKHHEEPVDCDVFWDPAPGGKK